MKKLLPLFLLLFALSSYSQTQKPSIYAVKINGAGLGTPHTTVQKKLGKPLKDVTEPGDECIGSQKRTFTYPGLEFVFHQESNNTPGHFYVGSFEVTSARWNVLGVKVGSTPAAVRRKFGRKKTVEGENPGETLLLYELTEWEGPGFLSFVIRKGKVVRISSFYIC